MKDLFKPVDTIVKYPMEKSEPITLIDVPTVYGMHHQALIGEGYLSLEAANDYDLMLRRLSLIKMFENRLEFLTSRTIEILDSNLRNLSVAIEQRMNIGSWVHVPISCSIVEYMKENFGELFDPRFFFDPVIDQYTCIPTIAMAVSGFMYNRIIVNIYDDIKDKYLKNVHENIVKIFRAFELSLINDLSTAMSEAKIYGIAGDCRVQSQPVIPELPVKEGVEPVIYDGILL